MEWERGRMKDIEIHFDDGEYAEKYLLRELEKRQKKYWINKQGQRVDIETMGDNYLLNCLALVRRTEEIKEMWGEYQAEMQDCGDR